MFGVSRDFSIVIIMNKLQQVFWELFVKNCEIDGEDMSDEDLATVKNMDKNKLLKVMKNFVEKLLDFKEKVKTLEVKELVERSQKFESVIMKLENDVRAHIGMHYRLKVEIDSYKSAIEEMGKELNGNHGEIKRLRQKISLQDKIIEKFKEKFEGKKKTQSRIKIEIDPDSKAKTPARVLTERSRSSSRLTKIFGIDKSKPRLNHMRCKSDLAKTLRVRIPV